MMPSASPGASRCILFVLHMIMTFLTIFTAGRLWPCHKTFWTLSTPLPQFKVLKKKFPFHTSWYRLKPVTIESLIKIVPHLSLVKMEQCLRSNSSQFGLEILAEEIVVIMMILREPIA